ncbi:MAG: SDR family oxidoreductase [Pseudomonadota bacterium]
MTQSTVLITGANRGIGLQFVNAFAQEQWSVIACCRDPQSASELSALSAQHEAVEVHALDVTDYSQMAALARQLDDTPIDILLSNAGIYGQRVSLDDVNLDAWRQVLEVNTLAPFALAQQFAPHVAASNKKLIALISSKVGSIADNSSGGGYAYRSSKTALNMVGKSLSIDLADRGISVVLMHPGWVQTDMGGPNALITVEQSVTQMMDTLKTAETRNGEYIDVDGRPIPW